MTKNRIGLAGRFVGPRVIQSTPFMMALVVTRRPARVTMAASFSGNDDPGTGTGELPRMEGSMKAVWYRRQGSPDEVLEFGELQNPLPGPGELRIRLAASAVNPADCNRRRGVGYALGAG